MLTACLALVSSSPVLSHVLLSRGGVLEPSQATPSPSELVRRIRYSHERRVILVIHGGLVSTESAIATAESLHPHLSSIGFPIYVSWETGPAFALFPPEAPARRPRSLRPDPAPEETGAAHPLGETERRLEVNTRAVARSVWGRIKAWAKVSNDPENPQAAMNAFMREFVPLWRERNLEVTLVAHSAGAIYSLYFLEALRQWRPEGQVDIVLLAPACTYAAVDRRLDLWKRHVRRFILFGLSDALERRDAVLRVPGVPRAWRNWYGASVLYYVSNNLEGPRDVPILGMQRFWALATGSTVEAPRPLGSEEAASINRVRQALSLDRTAVWSQGPGPGSKCEAKGHLSFLADTATLETIRAFIEGGS